MSLKICKFFYIFVFSVRGGVREEDHGGRTNVQGATEGKFLLQRVWGVDAVRIPSKSPGDSECEGGRDETELENPGRGVRDTDISYGIPGQGIPAELPGGGMPRTSGNEERDAGAIPEPACP